MLEKIKARFSSFGEPTAPVVPEYTPTNHKRDWMIGGIFIGAIALLLIVAGYVINRISSNTAYQKRWEDYEDCGWA